MAADKLRIPALAYDIVRRHGAFKVKARGDHDRLLGKFIFLEFEVQILIPFSNFSPSNVGYYGCRTAVSGRPLNMGWDGSFITSTAPHPVSALPLLLILQNCTATMTWRHWKSSFRALKTCKPINQCRFGHNDVPSHLSHSVSAGRGIISPTYCIVHAS